MAQVGRDATAATQQVRAARDALVASSHDYEGAVSGFSWPDPSEFNFALEWFDVVARENPDRAAVTLVAADLSERSWSYGELSQRSDQVANWLTELGIRRGDRVIVMLDNVIELWESMLALTKVGAVAIPSSTLLTSDDLAYRISTSAAAAVILSSSGLDRLDGIPEAPLVIVVGDDAPNVAERRVGFAESHTAPDRFEPSGPTPAGDDALLYFTSGTTSHPKLVHHTHVSYPIGHLTTMWWLGLRPGDVHLNISSPGWGKHAWSNYYAPFLAEATVFVFSYGRFDAVELMDVMQDHRVTTFCAPPTVWRMLIQADLSRLTHPPRELVGAGEPLNPEVIGRVRDAWGGTIRDGYGQTEMTCAIGNSPGQVVKDGSMGRPMPGYPVVLLDADGAVVEDDETAGGTVLAEGELALDLTDRIVGLMSGYHDAAATDKATRGGYYRTGDIASRDADGYLTYVGRADDVFKASDYKISPFELESIVLEHPDVVEAAVVPSPHDLRLAVPKAYVRVTATGRLDEAATAQSIFAHARERLSAYQRVRIIEIVDELPKTISGKIRRVELRQRESERVASGDEARQHREERENR